MICEKPVRIQDKLKPGYWMNVPCGKCFSCKMNKARDWSARCYMEYLTLPKISQLNSYFITLTYNDDYCPDKLDPDHLRHFFMRVRKNLKLKKFKYFACGEYGEKTLRPHYHFIGFNLFGLDDLQFYKNGVDGVKYFISKKLEQIWGFGFCLIGELNIKSIAYVAKYTLKKVDKDDAFLRVSQGLGLNYFKNNQKNILDNNNIRLPVDHNIQSFRIPKYFIDKVKQELDLDECARFNADRKKLYFDFVNKLNDKYKTLNLFDCSRLGNHPHLSILTNAQKQEINNQSILNLTKKRLSKFRDF